MKLFSFKSLRINLPLVLVSAAFTLLAIPVHSATSFPDEPLITGTNNIPPNILLILDDSGSMDFVKMPEDVQSYDDNTNYGSAVRRGLSDNPADRSYINNKIYYNPSKKYLPWRKGSNLVTDRFADAKIDRAPTDFSKNITGSRDLSTIYYAGSTAAARAETTFYVPKSGVKNPGTSATNYDRFQIQQDDNGNVVVMRQSGGSWVAGRPWNSISKSDAEEVQNFANWYAYHRTRMRVAKAGASEAFAGLDGDKYRVGFDTINSGNANLLIPIKPSSDAGLFRSANRTSWFTELQARGSASGGTPLRAALKRAGDYLANNDTPWQDAAGKNITCRLNYSILTTDGYWNGASANVGNEDKKGTPYSNWPDEWSDTLADVAFYYWRRDLKPNDTVWPNTVKPGAGDEATWQHMVTFGVSIGQQGSLDPTKPAPATWPNPTANDANGGESYKIDDLWHASLNGRGKFVVAEDAQTFATALKDALTVIASRTASGSNVTSTSTKTNSTTLNFIAGYTSGSWIGDMVASPFTATLTGVSSKPTWRLSSTFAAKGVNQDYTKRKVFVTWKDTATTFDSSLDFTGKSALDPAYFERKTGTDAVTSVDNVAYLLGDQSKEVGQTNGNLRARAYPFGDIIYSSPSYLSDNNMVFVGANDGMLHGIDAATGKVNFSYVPAGIDFNKMSSLSSPGYTHAYFVDGEIDVMPKASQGSGRSLLVGALGRGGKGIFALDVSDAASPNGLKASNLVLWDKSFQPSAATETADQKDMGYVLGSVRIRKGNGVDPNDATKVRPTKTYVFVPNGIESTNGSAVLFVYELNAAGAISNTYKLDTGETGSNGLMSLGFADLNGDKAVDIVYGGDLKGNVWRWDFSTATVPTKAVKLFTAKDASGKAQPITGGFAVGREPGTNQIFVGFGTGKYISDTDVPSNAKYVAQTQTMYGLKDKSVLIAGRGSLQQRTIPYAGTTNTGEVARGFENYSELPKDKEGWYVDLGVPAASSAGERVVTSPSVHGVDGMFLTSIIPPKAGADCAESLGSGFINAINMYTGTNPKSGSYFDDMTKLSSSGGGSAPTTEGRVSSVGVAGGMPTQVNVGDSIFTVGKGTGTGEDGGASGVNKDIQSGGIVGGGVGQSRRVMWREMGVE